MAAGWGAKKREASTGNWWFDFPLAAEGACEKMRKKICIFTSQHRAMAARIFFRQAVSLAREGYDVHVVGYHPEDARIEGIQVHAVGRYNNRLFNKILPSLVFPFKILSLKADIYHFHDPDLIPCGMFLALSGKNVVMDVHEDFKAVLMTKRKYIPKILRGAVSRIVDFIEKRAAGLFSGVVVVSEEIAGKFKDYNENTVLVRNFPPIDWYKASGGEPVTDAFTVIYTGGISSVRGCWQILDGFELFKKKCPAARLKMIGGFNKAEEEAQFRERARQIGSVDVSGMLPWSDVVREQSSAQVGILITSFQKDSVREAYPMKLFEYLSAGIPVVISRKPFFEKMLAEGRFGIMVDGDNPEEIAAALYDLYMNETKRKEMGISGRAYVRNNYSWENEFKNLSSLYERILKNPSC